MQRGPRPLGKAGQVLEPKAGPRVQGPGSWCRPPRNRDFGLLLVPCWTTRTNEDPERSCFCVCDFMQCPGPLRKEDEEEMGRERDGLAKPDAPAKVEEG